MTPRHQLLPSRRKSGSKKQEVVTLTPINCTAKQKMKGETHCRQLNAFGMNYGSIREEVDAENLRSESRDDNNERQSAECQSLDESKATRKSNAAIGAFLLVLLLVGVSTVISTGGGGSSPTRSSHQRLPLLGSSGRTSRTLIVLRHAKASRDDPSLNDIDRPLSKIGEEEIRHISQYLRDEKIAAPEVVFASPSVRTMETVKALDMKGIPVVYDQNLYDLASKSDGYIQYMLGLDSKYTRVMIVGHNPACLHLVQHLAYFKMLFKYPTSTYSEIYWRSVGDWTDAANQRGKLVNFIQPAGK